MANEDVRVSVHRIRGTVEDTGQRVTMDVPKRSKRRKGWRDHVAQVDIGVLTKIQLTGLESRVLWMIVKFIPARGGTEARVSLAEIAAETGIDAAHVSTITKRLRERHLLRTVRNGVHQINPWLAYSGDYDSWNAEAEKWPEPIWERGADPTTGEIK